MNTIRRAVFTYQCRGFALLETLIAFVVLAVGLVALLSFHGESQRNVAESKAQAEAMTLGEEKLQELESYLSENEWRLEDDADGVETSVQGLITNYQREWWIDPTTVGTGMPGNAKLATVTVSWNDRAEDVQSITLSSYIRNTSPPQDAENFLAVINAINSSGGNGFEWGTGTGMGAGTGDDGDGGDENPDDDGGGVGDDDADDQNYSVVIQGTVSGTNISGVNFNGVNVTMQSGGSYPLLCSYTNSSYNCTSSGIPSGSAWGATVTFLTNQAVCSPNGGAYSFNYASVTSHIVESNNDVSLNKSKDC